MYKLIALILILIVCFSCAPTNRLSLEVINPAFFAFPDTGKIVVLNASYSPETKLDSNNLLTQLNQKERLIFDTLIITNTFNGLFSILNQSPSKDLLNSEYQEIRTMDTTNFLSPISESGIQYLSEIYNASYFIVLEYFDFNRVSKKQVYNYDYEWWEYKLEVSNKLVWRIYDKNGLVLDHFVDIDTLYWYENIDSKAPLPELPDAVREAFYISGENYGKRICPFWIEISRQYYLISKDGDDISLDKEALLLWKEGKNSRQQSKAFFNLAILAETEDNLDEALKWINNAYELNPSELILNYKKKLVSRIEIRKKISLQASPNNTII